MTKHYNPATIGVAAMGQALSFGLAARSLGWTGSNYVGPRARPTAAARAKKKRLAKLGAASRKANRRK